MASAASSLLAFPAGNNPDNIPSATPNNIPPVRLASNALYAGTMWKIFSRTFTVTNPTRLPIATPKRLIQTDSNRNCAIIMRSVAPTAFLSPISVVLSLTEREHYAGDPKSSQQKSHDRCRVEEQLYQQHSILN